MKEIIIVAGKSKADICQLRYQLRMNGYNSIPCKSVEQIIEEMEILPTCEVFIPLVIIEPLIFMDISEELIEKLYLCTPEIPFLLFDRRGTEPDLAETFQRICKNRIRFTAELDTKLAKILKETKVEVVCS